MVGGPVQFEEIAPHDDGPHTYVSTKFPLYDTAGEVSAVGGIAMDITERKRAEEELRERESRMRAILDNAVEGIITMGEDRVIQSLNAAAVQIFGYEPEEVIGKNVNMLMPEPYHSEHDGYVSHYVETGEKKIIGTRTEVQARHKDGTVFPIELSISEIGKHTSELQSR